MAAPLERLADHQLAEILQALPTRLYVGVQNDGLFIIDEPPRPAPTDHVNTSLRTSALAAMTKNGRLAEAQADAFASVPSIAAELIAARKVIEAPWPRLTGLDQKLIDALEAYHAAFPATPAPQE